MLQLRALNRDVIERIRPLPAWRDMPELERAANALFERWRHERRALAEAMNPWLHIQELVDRHIRTEELEHLDEPDYPAEKKMRIVRALHHLNVVLRSYDEFLRVLAPILSEATQRFGRPARLLELASGSGEFTLALARRAREQNLDVEVTGSDYIPEYVEQARANACARGINASFEELNAFALEGWIDVGFYDVVFIAQSMHHFTPGQLAMMMAQASKVATTAFVGIDGYRSLRLLAFLPVISALRLSKDYVHDAFVTARKFYSDAELSLISELAAPRAKRTIDHKKRGFSIVTLRFDR